MRLVIDRLLLTLLLGISLFLVACGGTESPPSAQNTETPLPGQPPISAQLSPDKVAVQLQSSEALESPEGTVQRAPVWQKGQAVYVFVVQRDQNLFLEEAGQPPVPLPKPWDTLISQDGMTILQFGDEERLWPPVRTDLYWVDRTGKVLHQVVGTWAGDARLALSPDGFTAVAGELVEKPGAFTLVLYSPTGEEVWQAALEPGRRAQELVVARDGLQVVSITTNREDWLEGHRLDIWGTEGAFQGSILPAGVLQRVVLVGDGGRVFAQGYDGYGLADLQSGKWLWWQQGGIRMVSPYGAELSPDGTTLFLLLADIPEQHQATYRWRLRLLDAATGAELAQEVLPGEYPATWERVFEQVTANEVTILAGDQRLTYDWARGE